MASPRKKKAADTGVSSKLIEAFEFVAPAYKEDHTDYAQFCRIVNRQVISFNGVVAFGHPLDLDLVSCPHLGKSLAAIKRAGSSLSITEIDSARLAFKGDKLRVVVPCLDGREVPAIMPDPPCGTMTDAIKEGFAAVNGLVKEGDNNTRWIETCALMRANTIVATNGHVLLEYWHGVDLPPGLTVPRIAMNALAKITKKLTRFGFGKNSVTFYFEDGAWMRTQCFSEEYPPNLDKVIADAFLGRGPGDLREPPAGLWEAVEAVRPFIEADKVAVWLTPGAVRTHKEGNATDVGASFPVEGITGVHGFNPAYLKLIAPMVKTMDVGEGETLVFFGENIRGIVMKMR